MAEKKIVKLYYYSVECNGSLTVKLIDAVETPKQYKLVSDTNRGFLILRDVFPKRVLNELLTDSGIHMVSIVPNGPLFKQLVTKFYNERLQRLQEQVANTQKTMQMISCSLVQ